MIHGFWLEQLDLDASYRATHVLPEGLEDYFVERRCDEDWCGCNITIPHKERALDWVEDSGGIQSTIGAINTVFRNKAGLLMGTNTDAAGFYTPISGMDLEGAHAVVIGAGGAARAVLSALKQAGIGPVTLLNRTPLKAAGLLASFELEGDAVALDATLPEASLLVNASPLGMQGQAPLVLDLAPLPDHAVVYDLVYTPLETGLLVAARNRGLATVNGLDMLIGQAAIAFELFFGATAPRNYDVALKERLTV